MATFFAEVWLKSVVRISVANTSGTGFLMAHIHEPDESKSQVYLVTNKHVLGNDPGARSAGMALTLHVKNRDQRGQAVDWNYEATQYREHPRHDVDVCAVEITQLIRDVALDHRWGTEATLALQSRVEEYHISPGDDILTVGYPLGFSQGDSNRPLVRQGIIATSMSEDLSGPAVDNRDPLPAFLIDSNILPGSSGSPVFLKPVIGRRIGDQVSIEPAPALLLGILAETRFAQIPGTDQVSYAGLGLTFRAQAIKETLDLFPLP